jgi:hypothetical protein
MTTRAGWIGAVAVLATPPMVKLTAPDATSGDFFAWAVAIDDRTAVIAAREDDAPHEDSGSVHVFTGRSPHAMLTPIDADPRDRFGWSVAIDGGFAVIGARLDDDADNDAGSAYVFALDDGQWLERTKLTAPDAEADDAFGWSVAISGKRIAIGAPLKPPGGVVYIFEATHRLWRVTARIEPPAHTARLFGTSLALVGDVLVVGDEGDVQQAVGSGAAYIYDLASNHAPVRLVGDHDGDTDGIAFGRDVALHGNVIVVGAPRDNSGGGRWSGAAYVFEAGARTARLTASDSSAWDELGHAVAIHGTTILAGAPGDDDDGFGSGAVYVYRRSATTGTTGVTWTAATETLKLTAPDAAEDDRFGWSLALDATTALIGAPHESDAGFWAGAAYLVSLDD